jgi:hypothetical protein
MSRIADLISLFNSIFQASESYSKGAEPGASREQKLNAVANAVSLAIAGTATIISEIDRQQLTPVSLAPAVIGLSVASIGADFLTSISDISVIAFDPNRGTGSQDFADGVAKIAFQTMDP